MTRLHEVIRESNILELAANRVKGRAAEERPLFCLWPSIWPTVSARVDTIILRDPAKKQTMRLPLQTLLLAVILISIADSGHSQIAAQDGSRSRPVATSSRDLRNLPQQLLWIKDAPLFIDRAKLAAFYDAIVRPPNKNGPVELTLTDEAKRNMEASIGIKGALAVPVWLRAVFGAGVEASAEGKLGGENTKSRLIKITLEPIETPQRQLEQLTLYYLIQYPDRLCLVSDIHQSAWRDQDMIERVPRAIAFLDIPRGVTLIPTAAEFHDGAVVPFLDTYRKTRALRPPTYPSGSIGAVEFGEQRLKYWKWYVDHFDVQREVGAIESAASKHGRIQWIDFRLPVAGDGSTLHLHIFPQENYVTGTFAYEFIRRGYEDGLRIVGTLKIEPDMDVLAIYER